MNYLSLSEYVQKEYGCKLYKIALNAGLSCPNRDGTKDTRGCIFCSDLGSGEFGGDPVLSIREQLEEGKMKIRSKCASGKFIAYYQAYSNTYAPIEHLRDLYMQAMDDEEVAILSIATRPDCFSEEIFQLIEELNKKKPIWIELGLQTIHENSQQYIRRGYSLEVYDQVVKRLRSMQIQVIVHVILGLPCESQEQMLQTVRYVGESGATGIKLQLLQILKGTDLAVEYEREHWNILTLEEYSGLIVQCLKVLPKEMVIHRITGDGPKCLLIEPKWCADKKRVMNTLLSEIRNA